MKTKQENDQKTKSKIIKENQIGCEYETTGKMMSNNRYISNYKLVINNHAELNAIDHEKN